MCPKAEDFYCFCILHDFVDESVLDIDPSGISPFQITHELFIRRWGLIGIFPQQINQRLGFLSSLAALSLGMSPAAFLV